MHNMYYTCTMPYCLPTRLEYCVNALSTTWWWDEVILPAVAVVTMPLVSLYLLLGVGVYVFLCILWWRGRNLKQQLYSSTSCLHMCATFFIDGDFLFVSITLSVPFRSLIQLGTAAKCWQLQDNLQGHSCLKGWEWENEKNRLAWFAFWTWLTYLKYP